MKIILGFILFHIARSSPPPNPHLFEIIQSPRLPSKINPDDGSILTRELEDIPTKQTTYNIILDFTRRITKSTTRFKLPKRTRRKYNKTTTTTPETTPLTLPTMPASYSFPHTIFDIHFEKQILLGEVSRYFNFTRIPPELQSFYIWYYNVLHDTDAAERRKRVLNSRISYSPAKYLRGEILDHTVFQVPLEHQDYYVLVNDLAADTKDPTELTFPKGVTFYKYTKTTPVENVLDELLYEDRSVKSNESELKDEIEDGPNIFYTTRPIENTTTVITTTTPEPEPFDKLIDYNNLYKDEASWMTTDIDSYEYALQYLEQYKEKHPPGDDDKTYFF